MSKLCDGSSSPLYSLSIPDVPETLESIKKVRTIKHNSVDAATIICLNDYGNTTTYKPTLTLSSTNTVRAITLFSINTYFN